MKKRSKEILDLLGRRENDHTISTLAAKFEVSERTIRNDIKDINDYLKEQEIKPIRFGSNGLIVMEEDISQARETTQQEDFYTYKPCSSNFDQYERSYYIITNRRYIICKPCYDH